METKKCYRCNEEKCSSLFCKGKKICQKCACHHQKEIKTCRICSPDNFCIHLKTKHHCKECYKDSYCYHNKRKILCIDCSPDKFCEHQKKAFRCISCRPDKFCEHKRRLDTVCKLCIMIKNGIDPNANKTDEPKPKKEKKPKKPKKCDTRKTGFVETFKNGRAKIRYYM